MSEINNNCKKTIWEFSHSFN